MPYLRRLPSGKWQATIRGADGRKHTKTDPLKKVVKDWAAEEETKVAQGRWRDPRQAKQTFADWVARWRDVRVVAEDTNRLDASTLRTHVLPQWGSWRLGDIGALDVKAWVARMQRDGHSAHEWRRLVEDNLNDMPQSITDNSPADVENIPHHALDAIARQSWLRRRQVWKIWLNAV